MGEWFDELARTMASGVSRREALRRLGGGLMVAALASVLPRGAQHVALAQEECEKGQESINGVCGRICEEDGGCGGFKGACLCSFYAESKDGICVKEVNAPKKCLSSNECDEGEACAIEPFVNEASTDVIPTGYCLPICTKKKEDDEKDDDDQTEEPSNTNGSTRVLNCDEDGELPVGCTRVDGSGASATCGGDGGTVETTVICPDDDDESRAASGVLGLRKLSVPTPQQGLREIVSAEIQLQPITTPNYVNLTLYYTDAELGGIDESTLRLFFYHKASSQWVELPAAVDPLLNSVTVYNVDVSAFADSLHRVAVFG